MNLDDVLTVPVIQLLLQYRDCLHRCGDAWQSEDEAVFTTSRTW